MFFLSTCRQHKQEAIMGHQDLTSFNSAVIFNNILIQFVLLISTLHRQYGTNNELKLALQYYYLQLNQFFLVFGRKIFLNVCSEQFCLQKNQCHLQCTQIFLQKHREYILQNRSREHDQPEAQRQPYDLISLF